MTILLRVRARTIHLLKKGKEWMSGDVEIFEHFFAFDGDPNCKMNRQYVILFYILRLSSNLEYQSGRVSK